MLNKLKRLPFEERNEQDFEDLTRKIWDAIERIKKTRSIPTTQEKLAELVGCTRKTLHNRGWPITELKKIKDARKAIRDGKQKNTPAEHRLNSEKHIARARLLIGQIRNLQEQNSKLFDQVQELKEKEATLNDIVKVLENEINTRKNENQKLEMELRKCKQERNDRTNVVSIRTMKKVKGDKKKK
jgi:chromosome segregation ATPase